MTKSPRAVALAQDALPSYSSAKSRKDFTQHRLFAVPARKTFFRTDYRGVARLLADLSDLRDDLGLTKVPHYSTLCYAAARLLKNGRPSPSCAPPRPRPTAAVGGTGLESRHTSQYFFKQAGRKHSSRLWTELTVACDTAPTFSPGRPSPPVRPTSPGRSAR